MQEKILHTIKAKRRKNMKRTICAVLTLCLIIAMLAGLCVSTAAVDGGEVWDEWDGTAEQSYASEGEGTEASPYVIRTAEQWANLANASNDLPDGLYFVLEANLDFKNIYDDDSKLTPISPDGKMLLINFDGKGHTIKGVHMEGTKDGTGLFGDIWGNQDLSQNQISSIRNLVIEESTFKRDKGWISAVVGEVSGTTVIENVYVDKTVTIQTGDKGKAGGIVGGCYYKSSKAPRGEYTVTVRDCVFAGKILSAGAGNGGIVGYGNSKKDSGNDEVIHIEIDRCLVLGYVQHDMENSNGFVGYNGALDYAAEDGAKPSVKITNSILASGPAGEYYGAYPFCEANSVTVTGCYTLSAGAGGAMYKVASGELSTGATLLSGGINDLVGEQNTVLLANWTKRNGDVMIPTGVASFAPAFLTDATIKWVVDGEVILEETYEMGQMPEYKGETPTKPDDDTYSYVFNGWSPSISVAIGDATYTAEFFKTRKGIVAEEDAEEDVAETKAPEAKATETAPADTEQTGGCGSVVGACAVTLMAAVGIAVTVVKKKEQE